MLDVDAGIIIMCSYSFIFVNITTRGWGGRAASEIVRYTTYRWEKKSQNKTRSRNRVAGTWRRRNENMKQPQTKHQMRTIFPSNSSMFDIVVTLSCLHFFFFSVCILFHFLLHFFLSIRLFRESSSYGSVCFAVVVASALVLFFCWLLMPYLPRLFITYFDAFVFGFVVESECAVEHFFSKRKNYLFKLT